MKEKEFNLISKICDVLYRRGALKMGSVEGLADHFPEILFLITEEMIAERIKFSGFLERVGFYTHGEHLNRVGMGKKFSDCPHGMCDAIKRTIDDLKKEIGNATVTTYLEPK